MWKLEENGEIGGRGEAGERMEDGRRRKEWGGNTCANTCTKGQEKEWQEGCPSPGMGGVDSVLHLLQ